MGKEVRSCDDLEGRTAVRRSLVGVLLAAGLLASVVPAHSMQFQRVAAGDNDVLIHSRGPIVAGDLDRLQAALGMLLTTDKLIGLVLDSPGGSIAEAEKVAGFISTNHLAVAVLGTGECSSACFLLFAASPSRFAERAALIGVHSATRDGIETTDAMAATTIMARDAAAYGVPNSIVGKIVTTAPQRLSWLTPTDLTSMGVTFLTPTNPPPPASPPVGAREAPPPLPSQPPAAQVPPPTGAYAATTSSNPPTASFQQGLSDRQSWETWFNSLTEGYRNGAEFWSAERSAQHPGSCLPSGASVEWSAGCVAAQQRLAQPDVRRKTDPEYRLGWNSF